VDLWNVATPPADRNRLGFWHDELLREVAGREESLSLLPDVRVLYAAWKHLVHSYRVQDVNVNDARLVDVMSVYAVESLLPSIAMTSSTMASLPRCTLLPYLSEICLMRATSGRVLPLDHKLKPFL